MNVVIFYDCLSDGVVSFFNLRDDILKVDGYREQSFCAARFRCILHCDYFMLNILTLFSQRIVIGFYQKHTFSFDTKNRYALVKNVMFLL